MRPYTTREYNDYPYVIMTSDKVWNPSILTDHSFTENTPNLLHLLPHDDYDVEGEYTALGKKIMYTYVLLISCIISR